ncbi:hypothetical protein PUR49_35940 [Streptomyces sp. BE147]|uniref:hypothetical protein n=1 Tax=Streptomyces sp. BE147 TaxID=3002524 RepID=UPI002E75D30D|nr:hypothetical protein [Streptomyces sp. BE147]MEE1741869.1 hypothetical protein [Streptomyces sp. BE147]
MTHADRAPGAPRTGRPRRAASALAAALACAALAAGCGIRSTSVPVDAGAAPSRVPCRLSSGGASTEALDGIRADVYLVCASQLVTVERTVPVPDTGSDRLLVARVLLDEVRSPPAADERRAGFTTAVPSDLRVTGGRAGDPAGTLRLNIQPEDLSAEALAQLVCTYAENKVLVSAGTVVLGGPGNYAPRGYLCTAETKARPRDVPTLDAVELR